MSKARSEMQPSKLIPVIAAFITMAVSSRGYAADKDESERGPAPFQVSFWDSAQVIDADRSIHGVRLTLPYGNNRDIYGLDIGFANHTTGEVRGVQFSLGGYVEGD